ncbi:hypothetical protein F444_16723 [Phytophthora nicotianae P1976]|uniref:Uncharacterized protein n=1 Tax=Phytophthora nicotianae P1976 TaxID=1317066 RepID=A0A080ZHB0_PHYNI|nr:hypothetical protein F444_16723 [Phytophthora nicotianae P1976]
MPRSPWPRSPSPWSSSAPAPSAWSGSPVADSWPWSSACRSCCLCPSARHSPHTQRHIVQASEARLRLGQRSSPGRRAALPFARPRSLRPNFCRQNQSPDVR